MNILTYSTIFVNRENRAVFARKKHASACFLLLNLHFILIVWAGLHFFVRVVVFVQGVHGFQEFALKNDYQNACN